MIIKKWNLLFYLVVFIFVSFLLKIFAFSSFCIPSDSMRHTIIKGDCVFVNKLIYGARIFDVFSALAGERVKVRRVPGFSHIKRNDIIVFNMPYPNRSSEIEMDMMKYYIKRCLGISGDTVRIINGSYKVYSSIESLCSTTTSKELSHRRNRILEIPKGFHSSFRDTIFNYTLNNLGAFCIPQKGTTIQLEKKNYVLYKNAIEWELEKQLTFRNDTLWQGNKPLLNYTFTHNYYFTVGDNTLNSYDSRYWGLLPDDFIVGKAVFIWKSKDLSTGTYRWNRFMKFLK